MFSQPILPVAQWRKWGMLCLFALPLLPACAVDNNVLGGDCATITNQQADQPQYAVRALAYLKANPGEHRVTDPCKELTFVTERSDELQQKHVRFQQSYEGIPVWGQQLIVHFNAQNVATSTSGSIQPITQKIATKPKIDGVTASATTMNAMGDGAKAQDNALYIYQHKGAPRLVYIVNVMKNLRRTMIFVDAETGLVLTQISASPSQN
jgi:bacillolysin